MQALPCAVTQQSRCVSLQQQRQTGQQVNTQLIKSERPMDHCVQSSSSSQCHIKQEAERHRADGFPQLQQISHNLATDLYNVSDCSTVRDLPVPPRGCSLYYSQSLKPAEGFSTLCPEIFMAICQLGLDILFEVINLT